MSVIGLGGCGKTQLVLDYVETHRQNYDAVLWIDAEDDEKVRLSFSQIRGKLDSRLTAYHRGSIPVEFSTIDEVLGCISSLSLAHERLVVLDSVDLSTIRLEQLIPKDRRAKLILISQDKRCSNLLTSSNASVHVVRLHDSEARELLVRRLDKSIISSRNALKSSSDILAILDNCPLAIDSLGLHIANCSNPAAALESFPFDFRNHGQEMLGTPRPGYYARTITTVWDHALNTIGELNSSSGNILDFVAFFGDEGLEDEIFRLATLGWGNSNFHTYHHGVFELPSWLQAIA